MNDLWFRLLLGHLAGDYLLQSQAMALNKSVPGWRGLSYCTVHCLIYTVSICAFTWTWQPLGLALVFLSHWPIDRWSLAHWWLRLIKGRDLAAETRALPVDSVRIAFASLVYTVTDNTLHLILLWLSFRFFLLR